MSICLDFLIIRKATKCRSHGLVSRVASSRLREQPLFTSDRDSFKVVSLSGSQFRSSYYSNFRNNHFFLNSFLWILIEFPRFQFNSLPINIEYIFAYAFRDPSVRRERCFCKTTSCSWIYSLSQISIQW